MTGLKLRMIGLYNIGLPMVMRMRPPGVSLHEVQLWPIAGVEASDQ
ncbi:hypothetical protein LP414_08150 [Polaromonas sp. P1(28)-13]|nr:hypothetical protein LP414_08150 [Polaromonas sp. P1(28)-13]